jgi:formylglycine-generating enzyme required for sulfatase activity
MNRKRIFQTLLVVFVVFLCGASKKQEIPYIVDFNQRFVKVDANLYADKYELPIKDFQLFLKEKREAGVDCSLLVYDSTLWRCEFLFSEPMVENYFSYPCYEKYPIGCVSYFAANEFCKWLTEKYEANPKKQYKKVVFRLPTESEYKKAAFSIYDSTRTNYPWGGPYLRDKGGKLLCNFRRLKQEGLDFDDSTKRIDYHQSRFGFDTYTVPVKYYQPNPYGLYNMVGNVSEMIQEEGIAMGGDWLSTGYNVRITSKKKYEKGGAPWIGFRVFMEIIEF